jgi:hypothetical protein
MTRDEVFTAAQIASALRRSKRSVLASLASAAPTATRLVAGNAARVWAIEDLPEGLRNTLADTAARHQFDTAALFLASPRSRWQPKIPINECSQEGVARASLLRRALASFLKPNARAEFQSHADFEAAGVEEYRRVFGHRVTSRHWRRLFRRALDRDGGAQNWARLETYLDETPTRRTKPLLSFFASAALRPLQDLIASFQNPAAPTDLEKDCLWIYAFEHFEREAEGSGKSAAAKRAILKFLYDNAPFLGKSPKGIKVQFERKLKRWITGDRVPAAIADARKRNSGRPAPKFSEEEEHGLIAKALRCGGGITQAWRECRDNGVLNARVSQHYTSTPASKSYVPARIRRLVANKTKMLRDHHHGPRQAKLNGAFVNRDPSTFHSGDWFQADDVTLPNYYYTQNEEEFAVLRGQFLAMCDVRTTFILGYVLIPQRNYTAHHIRNLTTIVADVHGLPRKGFYYENGMWRTARLLHGRRDEINWHQTEMGLRGLGLQFRHAKLPRGKVIERVFGLLQNYLESEPGYAGRDERHDRFERVQDQISLVRRGKAEPSEFFLSEAEYLRRLGVIVDRYNNERQEGKYCPGLTPKEAFEKYYGNEPRIRLCSSSRHLLASHKMRVRSGRNGISFRFGKEQFTYKNWKTGELLGQELIAWFNVEDPSTISVTNLKEDPRTLFTVEREISVPGMDAPAEVLEAALAQNEAHEAYRKALYRAVSQNFSTGFAGRMFRQNLVDHKTAEIGDAITKGNKRVARQKIAKARRAAAIERKATRLGIAPGVMSRRPGAEEGFEQMTAAMRNLGLLKQGRGEKKCNE